MSWHIVHTEASQGWGGQEIRILTESVGMMERGHKVTLLCPRQATIFEAANKLGIETIAMPFEKRSFAAAATLRRWIRNNRIDVINTHSSIDSWLVGLAGIMNARQPAVVRTRHISAPLSQNGPTRWLYTQSAQRVVTTGESLRQDIIRDLRAEDRHVVSVPTGIDLQRYNREQAADPVTTRARYGIPADAAVLGIAATLRSWKGHEYLVKAFAQLATSHPDLHLLIAGDGPARQWVEGMCRETGHAERIHLIGHQDRVEDALACMDIFCLPSYANEGVPQAIMQAMAMDLPVISTPVGAITEVVRDGENGLISRPQDIDDLARKIASLLDDPEHLRRLAAAARPWVEKHFSSAGMVDAMEAVFQGAIEEKRT